MAARDELDHVEFGVVDGIERVAPSWRLELLPYVTGGVQRTPVESGDPLNDRCSAVGGLGLGLDVKYGLGPAFTLSATLNPDFGQVEADPSQVNLSANELFFTTTRCFRSAPISASSRARRARTS